MAIRDALSSEPFRRVNFIQRAEAAVLLCLSAVGFQRIYPQHWGLFALLFFVPDVSLLGYTGNALTKKRAGDFYNFLHSYALPVPILVGAWILDWRTAGEVALIWAAHTSFDRMAGYGLKLRDGFRYTHLGVIGRKTSDPG